MNKRQNIQDNRNTLFVDEIEGIRKMFKVLHYNHVFAFLGAIFIRWTISLNSYSGKVNVILRCEFAESFCFFTVCWNCLISSNILAISYLCFTDAGPMLINLLS